MSTWGVQVAVVGLFAMACGVLVASWLRGRLGVASIVLLAASLIVWVAAFVAISSEFRGANGFATCDDSCGSVHYVAAVAFIAPPLLVALAALAMLVTRGSRWRARRATGEGPA
ncbi:MAG TPA: hypothetical protein VMK83_08900 [Gaiellaceae bacterium]|nr:hypothetical protein [Gaiellaceae bacterium]